MVRLLKRNRWLWRELRTACDLDNRYGRRRERGNWELVAVAFVVSDYIDIQPWHDDSTESLWQACGFKYKPSCRTTWRRLRELASVADEFLVAAGKLLRPARSKDPRVMAQPHGNRSQVQEPQHGDQRQARRHASPHGRHGRLRREGGTARAGQANAAAPAANAAPPG
jgi:hypothetical protein